MRSNRFYLIVLALIVLSYLATALIDNQYPFFAGFAILTLVVMALAWNILGGYGGYVNFGSAAFFGLGAYSAIVSYQLFAAPLMIQIFVAGMFLRSTRSCDWISNIKVARRLFCDCNPCIAGCFRDINTQLGLRRRRRGGLSASK